MSVSGQKNKKLCKYILGFFGLIVLGPFVINLTGNYYFSRIKSDFSIKMDEARDSYLAWFYQGDFGQRWTTTELFWLKELEGEAGSSELESVLGKLREQEVYRTKEGVVVPSSSLDLEKDVERSVPSILQNPSYRQELVKEIDPSYLTRWLAWSSLKESLEGSKGKNYRIRSDYTEVVAWVDLALYQIMIDLDKGKIEDAKSRFELYLRFLERVDYGYNFFKPIRSDEFEDGYRENSLSWLYYSDWLKGATSIAWEMEQVGALEPKAKELLTINQERWRRAWNSILLSDSIFLYDIMESGMEEEEVDTFLSSYILMTSREAALNIIPFCDAYQRGDLSDQELLAKITDSNRSYEESYDPIKRFSTGLIFAYRIQLLKNLMEVLEP